MRKVWVVGIGVYDGFVVKAICTSARKARELKEKLDGEGDWRHEIEERFLDMVDW